MPSLEQPQADGVVRSRLSKVVGWWVYRERLVQFVKFCLVGGSGVVVDMGMLFLLADPKCLGLNVTLSKVLAAETALVNNFIWNELWTFRSTAAACGSRSASGGEGRGEVGPGRFQGSWFGRFGAVARRFLVFNGICGIGIGLAVLLLHLFHTWLGWNLYLANLLAIGLVTLWNFILNAVLTWGREPDEIKPLLEMAAGRPITTARRPGSQLPAAALGLVLLTGASFGAAAGVEFEGRGAVCYRGFDLNGGVRFEQRDQIVVTIKDCCWCIRKTPQSFILDGTNRLISGETVLASDLTNFYQLTDVSNLTGWRPGRTDVHRFVARVGPGSIPFDITDPKLLIVWYAFASSCYFATNRERYLYPPTVLDSRFYAEDFRVASEWELSERPPLLPREIHFGEFYNFHKAQTVVSLDELRNVPSPAGHFVVEEFAAYDRLAVPRRAWTCSWGRHPFDPTRVVPTSEITIEMSEFRPPSTVSFRPRIPGPAIVSDLRTICRETPFGVGFERVSDWPPLEASLLKARSLAEALAGAKCHRTRAGGSKETTIAAVILGLVLWPGIIWLAARKRVRLSIDQNEHDQTTDKP